MTRNSVLELGRLGALSEEKAKLLDLLLEKESIRTLKIRPFPRGDADGPLRLPASWAQQRLWFIDQLEGVGALYNIPVALHLQGHLDEQALHQALDRLVQRHEVLRTRFVNVAGEPKQEVVAAGPFSLQVIDLSGYELAERDAQVRLHRSEEALGQFDLRVGSLIRGRLLRVLDEEHVLLITMHHIVSDGWSMGVMIRELTTLYGAYRQRSDEPLPPLPIQYADYAQWQQQWLRAKVLEKQLSYWRARLEGTDTQLELPTDRPRPAVQSYRGGNVAVVLDAQLTHELKAFAKRHEMTLFMVLYAGWSILLSRLSGQRDIVIGTPTANRRRPELEQLIGFFVNTLVLRVEVTGDLRLVAFLERVKEVTLEAHDHQDMPFEQIVEALKPQRSLSRHPIFQVTFALQNAPKSELRLPGLTVNVAESLNGTAKFDLLLALEETGEQIIGTANYASDLFDRETVERWMACFTVLLKGMTAGGHERLCELPMLPQSEGRRILESFNATQVEYPDDKLIHELFEQQVRTVPEATAAEYQGETLTYAELNRRANQLAHFLRAQGIGADCLVAICIERGLEMLVALLGVLKAGGAYVPMDPNYPSERLAHMLGDVAPRVVLTQERLRKSLPATRAHVLALDSGWSTIASSSEENFEPRALGLTARHLAYVIYTSGSTGLPKGVMVEHRGVCNLAAMQARIFAVKPQSRVLQFSSFSFDAYTWEWLMALCAGACLCLAAREDLTPGEPLRRTLHGQRITHVTLPPIAVGALSSDEGLECLESLMVGGEACSAALVERWAPGRRFVNAYGPTEITVAASVHLCDPRETGNPPIGRPISNTQMYILDSYRQAVPIGVAGEIYIGGAGIARGYLNRPGLTAERFVADPFSVDPHARMYKTGDLGRWRADGTIEYLGRNDQQVKLRGFRIELGEIEAQLLRHAQVREAAVLAREDVPGDKRLVAYVVPEDVSTSDSAPRTEQLRTHLKALLPEYMVPSAFVMLERLPLTPNGKLDRRGLLAPELDAYVTRLYEAPQGDVEEILAGVWQALLRVERVGRRDNFFELGGHSLLIVQVMERLRRVGLSAELRDVFESPTLADLARLLTHEAAVQFDVPPNRIATGCEAITPQMLPLVELEAEHIQRIMQAVPGGASNIQDIYPLAPLQEGILFHHLKNEGGADVYVVPTLLSVASRERLDELIAALQHVIDRHDVLRTSVLWQHLPQPVQVVHRRAVLPVNERVLERDRGAQEQLQEWMKHGGQRLDLGRAPLMQLQVAADHDGQWYVLLKLHHIVADATSMKILMSEVVERLEGRAQQLPEPVPYRNHVAQLVAQARTSDSEAFFRSRLAQIDEPTAPFGLLDVHGDGTQIEQACEEFEPALARRVRLQARRRGVSAATLFHAAWGLVVASTSGRDEVVFGSVLLGRLHGAAGAQQILGMFINTLPLCLQLQGVTAEELVEQTQRELIGLLSHEQASLPAAQRCSGISGSTPLFSALLNYRHSARTQNAEWISAEGIRALGSQGLTNYPITLSVDDAGEGFTLTTQTDRRVDPHRVAGYLRSAVESLTQALEEAPRTEALALSILPSSERRQLVELFNATQATYPQDRLIHELFEEQVELTPQALAAVHGSQSLTYAELNAKANQLARYLRSHGVGADQLVGICVERGLQMVVGLLGILKAGGAYLPLDPSYPRERLDNMLQDAAPRVVLTQKQLLDVLPRTPATVIVLEGESQEIADRSTENLPAADRGLAAQNLVYVIYTSGSTGRPKGTAMAHRAMVNLIEWHRQNLYATPNARVLQFAALSFDVAFQETFSTLCTGGTLVLLDESVRRDAPAMIELLRDQRIERLFVPPLMLQSLAEFSTTSDVRLESLRDVITAGEQLRISPEIVKFFKKLTGCRLHNHYGPTETHVVTALTLAGDPQRWPALPTIGRPIANTQIFVLDGRRQPAPLGVAGEIYIGGAGLACGYLGRPDLTQQRFIADPFSANPRARLYKTGDLARWQTDGTIEYLGRNDDQVKIRGYRIELQEIEAQLARHAQVRDAAVVAREDGPGAKRLVAYVTQRDQGVLNADELRAHLKQVLPDHMVPSAFVVLETLPLTPSGKLNRRALPAPDSAAYSGRQDDPPQGPVETVLAAIWQKLLGVERVGRQGNFFELGGHSLLVLKALFEINRSFAANLRVTDVYKSPTIEELATRIREGAMEDTLVDLSSEAVLDADIVARPGPRCAPTNAILLTGATGFVGRFLLAQLLRDTDATIYCLVRARSEQQEWSRLRTMLLSWDLWCDEFERRIVAIPGDLCLARLGIDELTHQFLSRQIDTIYHCATSMNHLETYTMAKPANVGAVRELLRLATQEKPKLVNYISTLGIFNSSASGGIRVVDEATAIDHESHPQSRGYVASKWIGEKLIMMAAERGIPCNIFRLGLVWADTQLGRYDELQHDYRILKSCLLSGCGIRNHRYSMAPTPVDYVARAIVYLANQHQGGHGVFHLAASRMLIEDVFERCNEIIGTSLALMPLYDWICEMKRLHQEGRSLPVVPLIESSFSMDRESFDEQLRGVRSAAVRFDSTRTQSELEHAGIVAPLLDDHLLGACLQSMLARDAELSMSRRPG